MRSDSLQNMGCSSSELIDDQALISIFDKDCHGEKRCLIEIRNKDTNDFNPKIFPYAVTIEQDKESDLL